MVIDFRSRSDPLQKSECKWVLYEFGDFMLGIIQVPEGNSLGRAGLCAGGNIFTLFNLPPVLGIG